MYTYTSIHIILYYIHIHILQHTVIGPGRRISMYVKTILNVYNVNQILQQYNILNNTKAAYYDINQIY